MGLMDGLLGNASELSIAQAESEIGQLLDEGERIELAYKLVRDMFCLTDRRLILIDKQGLTGRKIEYHSIPYKSISHFAIETTGHFDLDAEMKIWISSATEPIQRQFSRKVDVYKAQRILARYAGK
ncbi:MULTISPECIES: PH domain-containing protein [Bordetella]|uniref:Cytoplasmic protein n=2 Tax=Bordetella TaxID=517 RepID=A0A261VZ14_9BORD|nr:MULTISPECIES: PH domain-containing protein [Bordetella]MDM9559857.1 PH domain-containing protein [Bordetella petrii]OZI79249.1 cytoplasmic protein [Bordetella genomosp. 2]